MTMSLTRSFDAGAGAEKMSVSARDEIRISSKISACSRKQQWWMKNDEHGAATPKIDWFFCSPSFWRAAERADYGLCDFQQGLHGDAAACWCFFVGFPCLHKELLSVKRLVDLLIRFDVPFGERSSASWVHLAEQRKHCYRHGDGNKL